MTKLKEMQPVKFYDDDGWQIGIIWEVKDFINPKGVHWNSNGLKEVNADYGHTIVVIKEDGYLYNYFEKLHHVKPLLKKEISNNKIVLLKMSNHYFNSNPNIYGK